MSLINEALKKAQRQRSDQPSGEMNSGGRMQQRGGPMKTQSVILIVAGAAVLVVFSVVITVYLLNRGPATVPATAPVVAAAKPIPAVDLNAPSPVIVAPAIAVPAPVAEKSVVATPPIAEPSSAPSAAAPTPSLAPVEIPPVTTAHQPELHIQLYVDAIRVMGIRSGGGESKVLMNDRVYRVNDIVDRALVLKLVKIEPELLTFTDPNGVVYTKSF